MSASLKVCLAAAIALASSALAQDAARVQPRSYRVVVDNPQVRVLEYDSHPGMGVCGAGIHSHPAHLTILLTPATVRVTQGGQTATITQPAGTAFWEPAVTHEVENIGPGTGETRALIVELKHPGR